MPPFYVPAAIQFAEAEIAVSVQKARRPVEVAGRN